ncbi:hypothetical protein J1N35_033403 [Gossypium stocksii]|uniref:Uncharacterized protein n=1 Tax=Gossypium stocksii TaxID=47602 RepID=A0A9D3UPZ9_9ROSI|nr:hypothetical protein J1N35_033403 [Gossypium stocksii]
MATECSFCQAEAETTNHLLYKKAVWFISRTATLVLKKAGRPSESLVNHENCSFKKPMGHECVHLQEITEAAGTEEAEANAEYDNALKEAIRGVQEAVTAINEHLEEVRYEIAALEIE